MGVNNLRPSGHTWPFEDYLNIMHYNQVVAKRVTGIQLSHPRHSSNYIAKLIKLLTPALTHKTRIADRHRQELPIGLVSQRNWWQAEKSQQ